MSASFIQVEQEVLAIGWVLSPVAQREREREREIDLCGLF